MYVHFDTLIYYYKYVHVLTHLHTRIQKCKLEKLICKMYKHMRTNIHMHINVYCACTYMCTCQSSESKSLNSHKNMLTQKWIHWIQIFMWINRHWINVIYIYIYTYIYIYIHTYIYIYVQIYMNIYMFIYTHTHIHICIHIYKYVYIYIFI